MKKLEHRYFVHPDFGPPSAQLEAQFIELACGQLRDEGWTPVEGPTVKWTYHDDCAGLPCPPPDHWMAEVNVFGQRA